MGLAGACRRRRHRPRTEALPSGGSPIGDNLDASYEADSEAAADDDRCILLTIEARLQRAGMELKFAIDGVEIGALPDEALIRFVTRAHSSGDEPEPHSARGWRHRKHGRAVCSAADAPELSGVRHCREILNGRQPAVLTATKLMADTRLPLVWTEQRKALGFA